MRKTITRIPHATPQSSRRFPSQCLSGFAASRARPLATLRRGSRASSFHARGGGRGTRCGSERAAANRWAIVQHRSGSRTRCDTTLRSAGHCRANEQSERRVRRAGLHRPGRCPAERHVLRSSMGSRQSGARDQRLFRYARCGHRHARCLERLELRWNDCRRHRHWDAARSSRPSSKFSARLGFLRQRCGSERYRRARDTRSRHSRRRRK